MGGGTFMVLLCEEELPLTGPCLPFLKALPFTFVTLPLVSFELDSVCIRGVSSIKISLERKRLTRDSLLLILLVSATKICPELSSTYDTDE